jgi:pimeloyl-ACP methyl ester carboxylesterase
MSGVAVLLIAIGCADIVRRLTARQWPAVVAGPLVAVITAALCGLWHLGDLLLVGIAAGAAVAWQLSCTHAERTGGRRQAVPLALFSAVLAALVLLSGFGSPVAGAVRAWVNWAPMPGLATVDPTRIVLVVGVVLLQLVTGNQLVRLLLGAVGSVKPAGEPQPSDRLKGGRLLGPMERLLIFGLSLAGQLAAATAVVAAKSIIRFPEINAQKARENGGIGIDDVTEYFLVGSFASWIVALGGLALTLAG